MLCVFSGLAQPGQRGLMRHGSIVAEEYQNGNLEHHIKLNHLFLSCYPEHFIEICS